MTGDMRLDRLLGAWRGLRSGTQDVLGAAAVAAAVLTVVLTDDRFLDGGPEMAWPLLVVAVSAPLALRRRFPVPVAVVVAVLTTAAAVLAGRDVGYLGAAVAIGSAAYHDARRVVPVAIGSVAWTAGFGIAGGGGVEAGALVIYAGLGLAPVAIGHALRLQAERVADLARLERARSAAERAEERARIARDVHDVVGHHLSAIHLQAVGARRSAAGPAAADRTLRTIASISHEALTDIRGLLDVLRTEPTVPVEPGRDDLADLVRRLDEQGLRVHVEVPCPDLPAALEGCAVRIVGEALTNVLRHSEAHHAAVRIDRADGAVTVTVDDPGPARYRTAATGTASDEAERAHRAAGAGIAGMRERAALLGGTIEAGTDGHGGWRVRASIPDRITVAAFVP